MFRLKVNAILIQLTGWLLFLLLPILFLNSGNKGSGAWVLLSSSYYWLFCITYLLLFYFNIWYLIPNFFLKKKYLDYALGVVILLGCVYFLQPYDKLLVHNPRFQEQMEAINAAAPADTSANRLSKDTAATGPDISQTFGSLPHQDLRMQDPEPKRSDLPPLWRHSPSIDIVSLVLFFIIIAFGISIRTVEQWQNTEKQVVIAEAEKATAELSFLKAQINPHFLFNTLNNIYTLSVMNSVHTSESIMKLSNIMRYVTDDVTKDFVSLQQDVDCIKDYIDLQKLRLGRKTKVNLEIAGNMANKIIAPLILMSFIENTFKYGISKQEVSTIDIGIQVTDHEIRFFTENKVFDNRTAVTERTGIGIVNTRQRLNHLYPNKHGLIISNTEGKFRVDLLLTV